MADHLEVTLLIGSLRSASLNKAAALHAGTFLQDEATVLIPDLAAIPLFNQDLETSGLPTAVSDLQAKVSRSDMIIIFSPEYNYGIPGPLKNAIDWLSRPFQAGSLIGKAIGIVSVSPSSRGGENVREQLLRTSQIFTDFAYGITLGIAEITELDKGALPREATNSLEEWLKDFTAFAKRQR